MKKTLLNKVITLLLLILASFQASAQFKVVGYMPSWSGSVSAVQYSKLTHINYAFLLPTATGGLQPIENPSKLQSLVNTAHANGVKVMISVGGWNGGDDSAFESLAANSTYRNNFVNNMVAFVNQYNLDGSDIDWEYPNDGASANNYVTLMTQLSTAMHSRGKLLTAAVVAVGGSSILASVFPQVDFLTIMAYDGDVNGSHHSTYDYAVQSINYWRGRGLPKDKAILGVPFYGKPSWESYAQLLARGASPNSDWIGNVGYNGIPTIKRKTNLAFDQGGGIMIWELSQDVAGANSLLTAIDQVVQERTGNPNPGPAPIGQTIWLRGSNGMYVSSENGEEPMRCDRATVQGWEQFVVVDAGNGKIALRGNNGQYVSCEDGLQPINCNRPTIQGWEQFDWITNADGTISLRAYNGLYVSSENGVQAMTANRTTAQGWEVFTYGVVGAAARTTSASTATLAKKPENTSAGAAIIYPNPLVKGSTFTVKVDKYDASSPLQVTILDVNKKVVGYHKANAGTITVPTSSIASGFYVVTITNGGHTYTRKIIIQ
jgi:predicted transglutaminase-like cysteine proteinase